jgi:hypothetical protein
MMKKTIFLLIFFTLTLNALSTKELAKCINLAGKQRMLTQKMVKEALLIKEGLNKDKNKKKLISSSKLFDKTLKGLIDGDSELKLKKTDNKKVQKELKDLQTSWDKLYKDIKKEEYKGLINSNIALLKQCDDVVKSYTKLVKSKASKRAQSVNLCGKERMLTQKMAKDILLGSLSKLQKDKKLFEKILNGLLYSDKELGLKATKLSKIKKALIKAQNEYEDIEFTKDDIDKLDELLITMDSIVKLYEKSINKEKKALILSSIINDFMIENKQKNHIINLAGKQRMLTQKMSKDAIILDLVPSVKDELIESYKLYDETLLGLLNSNDRLNIPKAKDKKIIRSIHEIQSIWSPFKDAITDLAYNKSSKINYIIQYNQKLLDSSNKLVKELKNNNKTTYLQKARLEIVDLAGRQRMLTQKMAKEKFLITKDIDKDLNLKNLKNTLKLFESTLDILIHGDLSKKIPKPTNKKIKEALNSVKESWSVIKPYYAKKNLSIKDIEMLNKKSNQLLKTMDKAVKLCESVRDY